MNELGLLVFCLFYMCATGLIFGGTFYQNQAAFTTINKPFTGTIPAVSGIWDIPAAIAGFLIYVGQFIFWVFEKVAALFGILMNGLFFTGHVIFTIINAFISILSGYLFIRLLKGWL